MTFKLAKAIASKKNFDYVLYFHRQDSSKKPIVGMVYLTIYK